MNFAHNQRGLGVAGWLMMILIFGGALTIGLKLFPLYMDHNTMSGVLDGLAEEEGLGAKRISTIRETVLQRFKVNNIRDFDHQNNMEIRRDNNGTLVILDYEVRVPLVHNVDLVASFDKQVRLLN
jgi:hypothetical protein